MNLIRLRELAFPAILLSAILGGGKILAAESVDVSVEKSPPTVERRVFNPWNPFEAKPKLEEGKRALTEYAYKLVVSVDNLEVVSQEERHGRWFAKVRPLSVRAKMSLPIVIWTPTGAPKKCIAHEEGHRVIAERIYEFAADIVKFYAKDTKSKTFDGESGSPDDAVLDAQRRAITELNQSYRSTVLDYAKLVQGEYDRLTEHGLNPITEEAAIAQSFESCSKEMARLLEDRARKQVKDDAVVGPVTKLGSGDKKSDTAGSADKNPSAVMKP